MDPQVVRCAFRLSELLETKHQFARQIDSHTKRTITLIYQSSTNPPSSTRPAPSKPFSSTQLVLYSSSSEPNTYTKEEFKKDLEYLAEAVVRQALRNPRYTPTEIQSAVRTALPPPPPALEEIQEVVQRAVDTTVRAVLFPGDPPEFSFKVKCMKCLKAFWFHLNEQPQAAEELNQWKKAHGWPKP